MALTPKEIVDELNKYVIGQDDAKRAVAIALRNRYRRNCLPEELRAEITPKNIIMSGPTGCGKTEISRRISKLMHAPSCEGKRGHELQLQPHDTGNADPVEGIHEQSIHHVRDISGVDVG